MAVDYTFQQTTYPFLFHTISYAIFCGAVAGALGVLTDYQLGDEFHPLSSLKEWSIGGALGGATLGFGRMTKQYYS